MKIFCDEWADALTEALNEDPAFRKAAGARDDQLFRYTVSGGPDGDVVYTLRIEGQRGVIALGEPDDADEVAVNFAVDYDTAAKMAAGKLTGQKAAMTGKATADVPVVQIVRLSKILAAREEVERKLGVTA